MKLAQIPKIETFPDPVISRRRQTLEDATLEELERQNTSSWDQRGLSPGYHVVFPQYLSQLILKKVITKWEQGERIDYIVNVISKDRPCWINIGYLNFRDSRGKTIHPIANYLAECDNDAERLLAMLGKTVYISSAECDYIRVTDGEFAKGQKPVYAEMYDGCD